MLKRASLQLLMNCYFLINEGNKQLLIEEQNFGHPSKSVAHF